MSDNVKLSKEEASKYLKNLEQSKNMLNQFMLQYDNMPFKESFVVQTLVNAQLKLSNKMVELEIQ